MAHTVIHLRVSERCENAVNPCDQICLMTDDENFACYCKDGYKLQMDGTSCSS